MKAGLFAVYGRWLLLAAVIGCVEAAPHRSAAAVAAFKRAHPCPVNGATLGSCPGYQVDHIQPLCAGGPDEPANMQWLTIHDHAHKTKLDVMLCRSRGPFKPTTPITQGP